MECDFELPNDLKDIVSEGSVSEIGPRKSEVRNAAEHYEEDMAITTLDIFNAVKQ